MSPRLGASRPLVLAAAALALGCSIPGAPPPRPAPLRERGAELYARTCAVCHGPDGEGYKADRAPALANSDFLASVSDELLRRSVEDGRGGTTMSAWGAARGGPLSAEDVDALIAFMRGWDRRPRAPLDERGAGGDAARGAVLYAAQCARCHGDNGVGAEYNSIGDPEFLRDASNGFLRAAILAGRRETLMPAFGEALGEAGVEDVLAYIRTWPIASAPRLEAGERLPTIPLGPVPLNPGGAEPDGFRAHPAMTSVDVVKAQLDRGVRLAFLDARAPSSYAEEHIAGAVNVPFYDPAPYFKLLPKDAWLVCYCACPHAESGTLAGKLQAAGFSKVTVLDEGFLVWKERGYPVHGGRSP